MTQNQLRKLHGLNQNTTIIPLCGLRFGASLQPNDSVEKYTASAVLCPASTIREIIIAKNIESIARFAKVRPARLVDDFRRW